MLNRPKIKHSKFNIQHCGFAAYIFPASDGGWLTIFAD